MDLTLENRKEMYVLYDDFGKLTLKNISNMYVHRKEKYLLVDAEAGENFELADPRGSMAACWHSTAKYLNEALNI